jgi:hypothetical protein
MQNLEQNKIILPVSARGHGSSANDTTQHYIFNKSHQNVISGKNPPKQYLPSSPMGSKQQLRKIFEDKPLKSAEGSESVRDSNQNPRYKR